MLKLKLPFVLFFLLVFCSIGFTDSERDNPFRFSVVPLIGYQSGYEFGKLLPLPNTADVPEITVLLKNKSLRLGFSLGYQLTRQLEIQGTFLFGSSEIQNDVGIGLGGFPLGIEKVSDAKMYSYSGSVVYHFPVSFISLYLKAGIGAVTLDADQLRSRTKLQLNFGFGARIKVWNRLFFLLEAVDFVDFFDYARDFELIYVAIYSEDFKSSQHRFGIHLGFGISL